MMKCAKCNGKGDVVDSRPQGADVWRRRQCRACGERWTTVESANPSDETIRRLLELLTSAAIDIDQVFRNLKAMKSRGGIG
jgi:transcriptional regulator NrdR family protein